MSTPEFQLEAQSAETPGAELSTAAPSPLTLLEAAIRGGVTAENVAVAKELIAMAREERDHQAKAAFARAFFQLRKNMPEIYADKERGDLGGYRYCSEEEISRMLEPHLTAYGFAMLPGQSQADGRITVAITLMHEQGHSETREFTVRPGRSNAAKDDSQADAGASTTAWRHLVMKMFGLKSRISSEGRDAAIVGERISPDKAIYLKELVAETRSDEAAFLKFARASSYEEIGDEDYPRLAALLHKKQQQAKGGA